MLPFFMLAKHCLAGPIRGFELYATPCQFLRLTGDHFIFSRLPVVYSLYQFSQLLFFITLSL